MEVVKMADKIKPTIEDLTPAQQIEKHKSQIAEIAATIKEEALRKANEAIAELKAIDLNYVFCEEGVKPSKKGEQSDAACPICLYKTTPVHDRRSHKKQAIKAPFTDEELKARGLVRVQ